MWRKHFNPISTLFPVLHGWAFKGLAGLWSQEQNSWGGCSLERLHFSCDSLATNQHFLTGVPEGCCSCIIQELWVMPVHSWDCSDSVNSHYSALVWKEALPRECGVWLKHLNCSSVPENDLSCGAPEIWKLCVEWIDVPGKGGLIQMGFDRAWH